MSHRLLKMIWGQRRNWKRRSRKSQQALNLAFSWLCSCCSYLSQPTSLAFMCTPGLEYRTTGNPLMNYTRYMREVSVSQSSCFMLVRICCQRLRPNWAIAFLRPIVSFRDTVVPRWISYGAAWNLNSSIRALSETASPISRMLNSW